MENTKSREIRVKASKDYDMFNSIEHNRPINQNHVNKLITSIERSNDLHLHPIVVTPDLKVIDGQHRLKAAEFLKIPIFYVTDSNYTEDKLMLLNSNQMNWSIENYIEFWAGKMKDDYIYLRNLKREFDIPYLVLCTWILPDDSGRICQIIKDGKLKIARNGIGEMNLRKAWVIVDMMKDRNYRPLKIYKQKAFHYALRKFFFTPILDEERFYERFENYPYDIFYRSAWGEYIDQFADIYNFNMKNKRLKVIRTQNKIELEV